MLVQLTCYCVHIHMLQPGADWGEKSYREYVVSDIGVARIFSGRVTFSDQKSDDFLVVALCYIIMCVIYCYQLPTNAFWHTLSHGKCMW